MSSIWFSIYLTSEAQKYYLRYECLFNDFAYLPVISPGAPLHANRDVSSLR